MAQTSAQQQTARLIELVLTKGNATAEVFRNWIQKNDVHLLRDLMGMSLPQDTMFTSFNFEFVPNYNRISLFPKQLNFCI